ncbi:MAG: helix-turn-helix transcriptional regulator [Clostridiales bacterium]|nr:helix-turn-helix transcriptional regulator [Clostridiales bacterium]
MSEINTIIGQRIRNYRKLLGLSQESLASLSDNHPTYIGCLERGEKNPTLNSLEKICDALQIPISQLFAKIGSHESSLSDDIPLRCYEIICSKSIKEQEELFRILLAVERFGEESGKGNNGNSTNIGSSGNNGKNKENE